MESQPRFVFRGEFCRISLRGFTGSSSAARKAERLAADEESLVTEMFPPGAFG